MSVGSKVTEFRRGQISPLFYNHDDSRTIVWMIMKFSGSIKDIARRKYPQYGRGKVKGHIVREGGTNMGFSMISQELLEEFDPNLAEIMNTCQG